MAALDAEWYLRDNPAVPTPAALEGTGDLAEEQWVPARLAPDREAVARVEAAAPTGPERDVERPRAAGAVAQDDALRARALAA